jgi:hypothetical protein
MFGIVISFGKQVNIAEFVMPTDPPISQLFFSPLEERY